MAKVLKLSCLVAVPFMVDYSLCRPAPETKDVLSTEKVTTGFAFTQNSRTFAPCLYLATRQINSLNSTSSMWQRMWKPVAFFLPRQTKYLPTRVILLNN